MSSPELLNFARKFIISGVANLLECIKEDPKPKNPDQIRKKRRDIPADEKKICLWVLDDGTACGKTFTKFDSLKRHVAESHKNVRPFCCTLCGKTYGRRDYLLRHLRSHNESDLANLATQAQLKEAEQMVSGCLQVGEGNRTEQRKQRLY